MNSNGQKGPWFILRAFQYRDYRLFFFGHGISLIGTWMQSVALYWLVYRLTQSALLLGLMGFIGQFPGFVITPFSGVLADRTERRRLLFLIQSLLMVQALVLAVLTLSGRIVVWHALLLQFILGVLNAFDLPVRQSFVADMVKRKEDFSNAIALNSLIFNGARLVGPALAGIIVAFWGEGACFLVNAFSYSSILLALYFMTTQTPSRTKERRHVLVELKEGFLYAYRHKEIRSIILLFAFANMVGSSYTVLMPVFAREILGGGPHTYGFLVGATGFGALCGALFIASRRDPSDIQRLIPRAAAIFGAGLIAFSFSRSIPLSMVLLAAVGFCMMTYVSSTNTSLQHLTDDDKRGRVMSFYAMGFMAMTMIGSLLTGAAASLIGAPLTLFMSGALCSAGVFFFYGKTPAAGGPLPA